MAIFGARLGYFAADSAEQMDALSLEIVKMLSSLVAHMEK